MTRTKEEARVILKAHRSALYEAEQKGELSGAFEKVAGTESDCSSASKGGDLGESRASGRSGVLGCGMRVAGV